MKNLLAPVLTLAAASPRQAAPTAVTRAMRPFQRRPRPCIAADASPVPSRSRAAVPAAAAAPANVAEPPASAAASLPQPQSLSRGPSPRRRFAIPRQPRSRLGDALVAYEFRRGKRRTIGFIVGPEGLVVSAPRWVPLGEVDAAVREKAALDRAQAAARRASATSGWSRRASSGRTARPFPSWASTVIVVLDPRHALPGRRRRAEHRRRGAARRAAPDAARRAAAQRAAGADPRRRAGLADAPGQAHLHRAAGPLRAAAGRAVAQAQPAQQRRHALGQRQRRRLDPPELAAGPLPPAGDRLRGGARTEPPARDGPQPALLGHGAHRGAGLRASCAASCKDEPIPHWR